jgi:hypothetical protein
MKAIKELVDVPAGFKYNFVVACHLFPLFNSRICGSRVRTGIKKVFDREHKKEIFL